MQRSKTQTCIQYWQSGYQHKKQHQLQTMRLNVNLDDVGSQMWLSGPSSLWRTRCYTVSLIPHATRQATSPGQGPRAEPHPVAAVPGDRGALPLLTDRHEQCCQPANHCKLKKKKKKKKHCSTRNFTTLLQTHDPQNTTAHSTAQYRLRLLC